MSEIQTVEHDGIMTIKLNRPEKLNAMRQADFNQLTSLIEGFRDSPDLKVLILTGNGRAFCAGEDLNELLSPGEMDTAHLKSRIDSLQYITELIINLDKPTIAAVNGPAVGFGFEVTLACDVRIASENAYFWFSEVKRGLLPTNASFFLLPRLIGLGPTTNLMLTAEKVSPEKALQLGILSTVTSSEDLMETAMELAKSLLENSETATRLTKQILRQCFELDMREIMELEVLGTMELATKGDIYEGAHSFIKS